MSYILAQEVVEGSDETLDEFAGGLYRLANAVRQNGRIHEGTIEWFERHARFMRDALDGDPEEYEINHEDRIRGQEL